MRPQSPLTLFRCPKLIDLVSLYSFPPNKNESPGDDPVIGQVGGGAARVAAGLDPLNDTRTFSIPEFITPRGGEYFFSPSISALANTIGA